MMVKKNSPKISRKIRQLYSNGDIVKKNSYPSVDYIEISENLITGEKDQELRTDVVISKLERTLRNAS